MNVTPQVKDEEKSCQASLTMIKDLMQWINLPIMSTTSDYLETTFAFAGLDDECE